jgi:hypothetical protein
VRACALVNVAQTTAHFTGLSQVPAEARAIEAVGETLDETAAAEDSICVQSDSAVRELGLWVLLCPCAYLPVQTQVPTRASSGTGHLPPQATSSARQPPSVAWPDATSPEGEHQKIIIAEMASAVDASRAAEPELALQRQITDLRVELRRATKELSSLAETHASVPDTTQPLRDREPYVVNAHPH